MLPTKLREVIDLVEDLLIPFPFRGGNRIIYTLRRMSVSVGSLDTRVSTHNHEREITISGEEATAFYRSLIERYGKDLLYLTDKRREIDMGSVRSMSIIKADFERNVYEGYICSAEDWEREISLDEWIAFPTSVKVEGRPLFKVQKRYPFILDGQRYYSYTDNPSFNKEIQKYVLMGIMEFNPTSRALPDGNIKVH